MEPLKHVWKRCTALVLCLVLLTAACPAQAAERAEVWPESLVIAHRLGEVDGVISTNSREAFLNSCEKGLTVLETDFMLTTDGVLAVRHDWGVKKDGVPVPFTVENHLNTLARGQYTCLTAGTLLTLMMEHPEIWLVTDSKEMDPEPVRREFQLLVAAADAVGARSALDRMVVQVYDTEMKAVIEEVYPFQNWILTVYQLPGDSDYGALADYCAANGIGTMTAPVTRLTAELVETVHARGLRLYIHTLNDLEQALDVLEQGADGVYSGTLSEAEVRRGLAERKLSVCRELFREAALRLLIKLRS